MYSVVICVDIAEYTMKMYLYMCVVFIAVDRA